MESFRTSGLAITPQNYEKVFCKEAKKQGFVVADCEQLNTLLSKLPTTLKEHSKRYPITNVSELVVFLISSYKQLASKDNTNDYEAIKKLLFASLDLLFAIPDLTLQKNISKVRDLVRSSKQTQAIEILKELLMSEHFSYAKKINDVFFVKDLRLCATKAKAFYADLDEEVGYFLLDLSSVLDLDISDEIQASIEKTSVLKKLKTYEQKITKLLLGSIKQNVSHAQKMGNLAHDIKGHIEIFDEDLDVEALKKSLVKSLNEIESLEVQMQNLHEKLRLSSYDYLTQTLGHELIIERCYEFDRTFGKNFWLSFLRFKDYEKISKYGRFACDTIIKSVVGFIKQGLNQDEHIGRYSGDVFLVVSTRSDLCQRLKDISKKISHSTFMYKKQSIKVDLAYACEQKNSLDMRGFLSHVYDKMNDEL